MNIPPFVVSFNRNSRPLHCTQGAFENRTKESSASTKAIIRQKMPSSEETAPAPATEEAFAPTTAAEAIVSADLVPEVEANQDEKESEAPKADEKETAEAAPAPTADTSGEPAAADPEASSSPPPATAAPSKPSNRTAEIWSTRLHREILALTKEGGDDAAHQHDVETVGVLPPFIALEDHTIDIAKGLCDVTFRIAVEPPSVVPGADDEKAGGTEGAKVEGDGENAKDGSDEEGKGGDEVEDKAKEASAEGEANATDDKEKDAGRETEDTAPDSADAINQDPPHVIIMLDASTGTSPDGGPAATPASYPFQPPTAMLISGANLFPQPGSEINDGDYLDIDLDWTPSLHLNDAILNVALKVRESIRRGEPFYAKVDAQDGANTTSATLEAEVLKAKEKVTSFFSSGLTTLKQNASSMAAVASEVVAPHNVAAAAGGGVTAAAAVAGVRNKEDAAKDEKKKAKREVGSDIVAIGDEIDLSQSPWNVCAGMYSCKAIRRPVFVELAMSQAEAKAKEQEKVGVQFHGIISVAPLDYVTSFDSSLLLCCSLHEERKCR